MKLGTTDLVIMKLGTTDLVMKLGTTDLVMKLGTTNLMKLGTTGSCCNETRDHWILF